MNSLFCGPSTCGTDSHTVRRSGSQPLHSRRSESFLGIHVDPHPGILSSRLSPSTLFDQFWCVEFSQHVSIGPDSVLPVELQVMGVVGSVDSNKLIRFES